MMSKRHKLIKICTRLSWLEELFPGQPSKPFNTLIIHPESLIRLILIMLVFLCSCNYLPNTSNSAKVEMIDQEEYKVYSSFLKERLKTSTKVGDESNPITFLIDVKTKTITNADCSPRGLIKAKEIPVLPDIEEVVEDYERKNKASFSITASFDPEINYVLISHEEVILHIKREDSAKGWEDFLKKYPGAKVYDTFSRVGFNPTKTKALMSRSYFCGPMCVGSYYTLFSKENGVWKEITGWCSSVS
jgi:hypothetical protein